MRMELLNTNPFALLTFRKWLCLFKNAFAVVTEITLLPDYSQIANSMVSTWTGPPAMKSLFTRMFCCKTCPNIVKTNNFMSFQSYFLQKVQAYFPNFLRLFSATMCISQFNLETIQIIDVFCRVIFLFLKCFSRVLVDFMSGRRGTPSPR